MEAESEENATLSLDELKEALINHVCNDSKSFFRHQQRDEEEIKLDEKLSIARDILNDSHTRFLSRFGTVLKKEHLEYFESQKHDNLVDEQIKQIKFNLDHEKTIIKNRRYAAMMKLIDNKEYFSDYEMERRNPVLYNDLVGRFISPAEKAKRRRPNAQVDTLVDVLLEKIDHDEACENLKRLQNLEGSDDSRDTNSDYDTDAESSNQWGNFQDETVKTSQNSRNRKRQADLFITAGERDMLREEFLGIMYNEFLMGKDTEFFDYSKVDGNEQYDEVFEKSQDIEDKYFEDEDSLDDAEQNNIINARIESSENEEDELDIYMRHIEEHVKRQKQESFQEESDDE